MNPLHLIFIGLLVCLAEVYARKHLTAVRATGLDHLLFYGTAKMNKALAKQILLLNKQRHEKERQKDKPVVTQEAVFSVPEPPPRQLKKPKNAVRIPNGASFASCRYCKKGIYFSVMVRGEIYPLEPLAGFANYGSYHFCKGKREFDKERKTRGRLK